MSIPIIDARIREERLPFSLIGGRTGVLFLHGFMGSPLSCRTIAYLLHQHNMTVHVPLLPGHGHLPTRLANVSHQCWLEEAERALIHLQTLCDDVFVVGHSMGAVLAAHLAINNCDIRGVITVSPLINVPSRAIYLMPIMRHILPFMYPLRHRLVKESVVERRVLDYDATIDLDDPAVREQLDEWSKLPTSSLDELRKMANYGRSLYSRIYQPILVMQGKQDSTLDSTLVHQMFDDVPSSNKELYSYPNSNHRLMRVSDPAHPDVWFNIIAFIKKYAS